MTFPNLSISLNVPTAPTVPATQVLLIEDNLGDARLVEILLDEADMFQFQLVHTMTLQAGLAALAKQSFAVVLLDLTLPDSRGFETLQALIAQQPDVNVVVMTGLEDKVMGLEALKAGAQDFLTKGRFDADSLVKTLRYSIERKSVLMRLAESQRAREVAEESARLKEQFIAGISHEMRTPMNAIYGMSNLLAQTKLSDEQNSFIHSIRQSSEVLLGVINDILEISTLQNGKVDFTPQHFDIQSLMFNLVNVMQYKKDEKNLLFALEIAPDVPQWVVGDKLRLNQILFNIVGNAVKFTDEGFVNIEVQLAKPIGDADDLIWISFKIHDSGIGIPTNQLDVIFDSFTRVRSRERLFEGTGLGLAIVKNLITLQNGRIWAQSQLGVGTSIHFELPMRIGNDPETDHSNDHRAETPMDNHYQDSAQRAFRLLLVEDHKLNQIVACKTLERQFEKMNITVANHGQEALDLLEKGETYDVILMDIQMPVLDGNETIAYIRANMPNFTTPVLAMTAHAYISKDNIFKQYGFDDFVLKPFEPEQLFSKIHWYLQRENR
jgi:signal transduction histidine kinase